MSNFVTISVHGSNRYTSSTIRQIGMARFENGVVVEEFNSLVNEPNDGAFDFSDLEKLHGITAEDVKDAPSFRELYPKIQDFVRDRITVYYYSRDDKAMYLACMENNIPLLPEAASVRMDMIAMRMWDDYFESNSKLENIRNQIVPNCDSGDALENAKSYGKILLLLLEESKKTIEEWANEINISALAEEEENNNG